ncbi:hypothetical protein [Bradyrhizobium sp.]|uniref:hypothetical protein n=1 Tax=Bradyrhizobium sp. TaxID=376 RepID=UPI00262EE7A9|nr:hypothetical protein [Bradyrhizobium sp.]
MKKFQRRDRISSSLAFACLMSAITPGLAQDAAKSAPEKWRPKDGLYDMDDGGAFVVPCEHSGSHQIELAKRLIGENEVYKCIVTKVTDVDANMLRLNANCDDVSDGKIKSVITLRKIDDKSFFMSWSSDQGSRFTYCEAIDAGGNK